MSSKPTPVMGWPRTSWQPPVRYTTGPHRWVIVWTGHAHVWQCGFCQTVATAASDVKADCPKWGTP